MASTCWANEALYLHITGEGACHLIKAGVEEAAVNIISYATCSYVKCCYSVQSQVTSADTFLSLMDPP